MSKPVILISDGTAHSTPHIAKALKDVANIVLLGNDITLLEKYAKENSCDFVQCNPEDANQLNKALSEITKHLGKMDYLLVNTDKYFEDAIELAEPEKIKEIFVHNSVAKIVLLKQTLEHMLKSEGGTIINLFQKSENREPYRDAIHEASNAGYIHVCNNIREELNRSHIFMISIEYEVFGENVINCLKNIAQLGPNLTPRKFVF